MSKAKEITTVEGEVTGFVAVIERALTNPEVDVDKLERLLNVQERVMSKQAEITFNQAMARLQPRIPVIFKNKSGHNSNYATYEEIDRQIRPLYNAEGFSVSYNSRKNSDDTVTYFGILSHVDGHSRTSEIDLPADSSGSKSAVQAKGSTMSYAKRYLLGMMFNIITTDDKDGAGSLLSVNDEQIKTLEELIKQSGADVERLCHTYQIEKLSELPEKQYKAVKVLLQQKLANKEAKDAQS